MKTPGFDIFLHDVTARQKLYASDVYIKWCIKSKKKRTTSIFLICIAKIKIEIEMVIVNFL